MVEISKYGSGEGQGRATAPGYSTAPFSTGVSAPAGTASDPIRLWAYPGAEVRLDFSGATGAGKGLSINVSYWHVKGLTFYNCVAYNNPKAGFEAIGVTTHILKNNISYKNGKPDNILDGSTVSNNSWNGLSVSDADFVSLDDSVAVGPRQADGSLPESNFLKLATGSGLIDKGADVGLAYKGAAPDLGVYECR